MYPLAVIGNDATARATILACRKFGFDDITWADGPATFAALPAYTLGANLTRIVHALGEAATLHAHAYIPDREQVRIAASGFLLSELPLGDFATQRYGAPHVNIDGDAWASILPIDARPETNTDTEELITRLEHRPGVVIVCDDSPAEPAAPTHRLWHARLPFEASQAKANVTWLARAHTAWQFSTASHQHVYFATPLEDTLRETDWHPQLHDALRDVRTCATFRADATDVRQHWQAGNVVYAGSACYPPSPFLREAAALGLEDAWVLSRMLENYEEDLHDGLLEYERYRRPRAARTLAAASRAAQRAALPSGVARWMRNLNIAFSARFVPEIAMQRIDWLYNYDCIKGFR